MICLSSQQRNEPAYGGLASIAVKDDNNYLGSDGTDAAVCRAVAAYGGYGGWSFSDFDSGVRLGESDVTPVAVYVTWNPTGNTQWATAAEYQVLDGATVIATIQNVDQSQVPPDQSPEPNDRRWLLLGVYNVDVGHTLTVRLSEPSPATGDMLCVGDAMIHPLWPTVDIQQTGVSVPSQISTLGTAAASDYVDWFDAVKPIQVPVEGSGSRVQLHVTAAVDALFSQAPEWNSLAWDWTAKMPAVAGVDYFAGAEGSTVWEQDQAITPGSPPFTSVVWAATDPVTPPADSSWGNRGTRTDIDTLGKLW